MKEIELSNNLQQIELEIKHHKNVAGQSIWEIGRRLNHVKENDLAHGQFTDWVNSIGFHEREAQRFIKVATELPKTTTWSHLGNRALYLIATLPEEEREKEHILESGKTKKVDEMVVREIEEVKRKLRESKSQLEKAEQSEQIAIEKLEREQNKEPKVIREPYIPDDYQQLEKAEKKLRNENKRLSEEVEILKDNLETMERTGYEVNRMQETIKQLDKQKAQITNILDANDKLTDLEKEFHEFFDANMSPLKYKPLINELYEFNGTERMKELVNLTRAWVDDMDRMLPSNNRKIVEGEIINE